MLHKVKFEFENTQSLKLMLKFTLFLLLDNRLGFFGNFLGTAGSLIIKSVNTDPEVTQVLRVVYYVLLALLLIPTPILIFDLLQASSHPEEKVCVEGLWQVV